MLPYIYLNYTFLDMNSFIQLLSIYMIIFDFHEFIINNGNGNGFNYILFEI